jgi:antitoxin YefM
MLYSMKTTTYTDARANLAALMDSVTDDAEEVVITRSKREPVVMVSLAEWESFKATDHLLRNPVNGEWLRESIAQDKAGAGAARELLDPGIDPDAEIKPRRDVA